MGESTSEPSGPAAGRNPWAAEHDPIRRFFRRLRPWLAGAFLLLQAGHRVDDLSTGDPLAIAYALGSFPFWVWLVVPRRDQQARNTDEAAQRRDVVAWGLFTLGALVVCALGAPRTGFRGFYVVIVVAPGLLWAMTLGAWLRIRRLGYVVDPERLARARARAQRGGG